MKDAQIIELLRQNKSEKAVEKLYHYFPVIKNLVVKNNGSKQDAEDIYQEALVILIRKAQEADFKLTSSLNTYIYSVCRFLWNDELKKKNKKIEVDVEKNLQGIEESEIENYFKEESQYKLAEKAINLLGEKCKQLLNLFYFKKVSLKEIALKLKFGSDKVAKNQKYRCIEKAKENLQNLKNISHE